MSGKLSSRIVDAIRSVVGTRPVGLHEPTFVGNELSYLKECIETTYVASRGSFIERFESYLSEYTGSRFVVAVSSGTAALHVSLVLAGVEANDEVLIPDITFVATANAVTYCGAYPHIVDCEEESLGIDVPKLKRYLEDNTEQRSGVCVNKNTQRVIKAIVPMHVFGHPVELDSLLEVAHNHQIKLIEDAAEALGSFYQGKHVGCFGLMGALSFNGNKVLTTGGGGAILTDDKELGERARHLSRTARVEHPWNYDHDEVGFNYRLPNLNAALGCAQMEQLESFLVDKRRLFGRYQGAFHGIPGLRMIEEPPASKSNYWLQTLMLDREYASERDHVLAVANEHGYQTRPIWRPMSDLAVYGHCPRMENLTSKTLAARALNIPSSPGIDKDVR